MMIKLMTRFPRVVTFGACLTGWVGGETIASDVAPTREFAEANSWLHYTAAAAGALAVLAIGKPFKPSTQTQTGPKPAPEVLRAFAIKPTLRGRLFLASIK
jgi:predicted tellurium resistance membrane protein TerC